MKGKKLNTKEFISRANVIHNNKYNYDFSKYTLSKNKITITCPIHGKFNQKAGSHLNGNGCPECAKNKLRNCQTINRVDFISKVDSLHGFKYDYSKVIYVNNNTKVTIICPEHGEFQQTPRGHLTYGCNKCHIRGYSKSNWVKIAIKNKKSLLYIIKCYDEFESFVKIGITSKNLNIRFSKNELPYKFDVISIWDMAPDIIWEFEKELHRDHKEYSYIPNNKFSGMYECFDISILEPLSAILCD